MAPVTTRFDTIDASDVLAGALDEHRRALTGYCYGGRKVFCVQYHETMVPC